MGAGVEMWRDGGLLGIDVLMCERGGVYGFFLSAIFMFYVSFHIAYSFS